MITKNGQDPVLWRDPGWSGILQADAYAGFNGLYRPGRRPSPVTEAACWVHGRRKLFVLADVAKTPLPIETVRRTDAIFSIEREINGCNPAQRLATRQQRIKPLLAALHDWMRVERATPTSPEPTPRLTQPS